MKSLIPFLYSILFKSFYIKQRVLLLIFICYKEVLCSFINIRNSGKCLWVVLACHAIVLRLPCFCPVVVLLLSIPNLTLSYFILLISKTERHALQNNHQNYFATGFTCHCCCVVFLCLAYRAFAVANINIDFSQTNISD